MKKLFLSLFFIISFCNSKVILFDFTGVLGKRSGFAGVKNVGFGNLARGVLRHPRSAPGMKNLFLDYMRKIPASDWATQLQASSRACCDDSGKPLPPIMADVQAGRARAADIQAGLNKLKYPTDQMKNLILGASNNLMPGRLAGMMSVDMEMVALVKELKAQGHTVAIFSNFDKEAFRVLMAMNPVLFDLFDRDKIFISGEIGFIKPLRESYKYVISKLGVNPLDIVFIDDQEENISGASDVCINGILHKSAANTRFSLFYIGVLSDKLKPVG